MVNIPHSIRPHGSHPYLLGEDAYFVDPHGMGVADGVGCMVPDGLGFVWVILLMAEILHQLICSSSHYLHGFMHPRWCRISSINSMNRLATECIANDHLATAN